VKEDRWLTSNDKMRLAPRDIFDQVLSEKSPALSACFKSKKAKKDKVMEIVCFVADLDLNCAVLSKHVDTLVEKLAARWDEMVETRMPGFPVASDVPLTDADVQQVGYFELKVVDGSTCIKHKFSDNEAKLPDELQGKTWTLECNLNHKKASIKSGDLHEFLESKVFSLVEGLEMPSPLCLKQVPAEDRSSKSQPGTPRTPVATPTSTASGARSESLPRQLSYDSANAEAPPPPPTRDGWSSWLSVLSSARVLHKCMAPNQMMG
jgi:hypothetical protein